ncbi:MAG: zinc metalloprotease HtpX [Candidatus Magasanikbacteria bacterium RIFOXYC2_FULL_40_16]|uniref:Protease HtpX homolog n=3 Tax=Candidatus Magasanikiibacteriota TaxID=1752731 RepID=A0A1F6NGX2_9BACT|nr:MAG: zinc metalloprotease HtpX [Candidatus Magasanikbacteria bacterium RIFOXYB1_FULL_40_15]OGH90362.1 MAG: zinc metalloprotease HtpX [Candidatus Magasanikbacteria bacterium RIFOXYC2_FULL_40_16]
MYSEIDSNKRKTYLLISIFIAVIAGIGWFLDYYMDAGYGILVLALILSVLMSLTSFYQSDKIALWSTGAKEIKKEDNPYAYRMVENLCITAGLPMPKVHIINSKALNAFATGRDPEHASIALTTGIIERLENEELEGVIAHELSHIKNYDIRLMTVVVVLVGVIALIGDLFFRMRLHGGGRSDNRSGGNGIIILIGIIFILLSPIVAEIIKLAISRKREYMADASGALLTRYPEGLARALEKISQSPDELKTANSATAHLFISNPLKKKNFSKLFSTHPPVEDRILKLREM